MAIEERGMRQLSLHKFRIYLRTGRVPAEPVAEEVKFNP